MSDSPQTDLRTVFRHIVQIGVVVTDLDAAMANLTRLLGVGPWRVVEGPPAETLDRQFYRGGPAHFRNRWGFADLGAVELELIQPLEGPSIYTEFLQQRGPGIHHLRWNLDDNAQALAHFAACGVPVTQQGPGMRPGTTWVNFDTEPLVGFTVEIMNALPGTDGRSTTTLDERAARSRP